MRLPAAGLSDAACLDFDFAVRALKRWADRRADETIQVQDHRPAPDPKKRMKTVPKYPTLLAVLGMEDEVTPDAGVDAEVQDLMAAMLTNPGGWEGFGGGL